MFKDVHVKSLVHHLLGSNSTGEIDLCRVKKLYSWLVEGRWLYPGVSLCLKYSLEGHPGSYSNGQKLQTFLKYSVWIYKRKYWNKYMCSYLTVTFAVRVVSIYMYSTPIAWHCHSLYVSLCVLGVWNRTKSLGHMVTLSLLLVEEDRSATETPVHYMSYYIHTIQYI